MITRSLSQVLTLFFLIGFLIIVSHGQNTEPPKSDLENTIWFLTIIGKTSLSAALKSKPYIRFDKEKERFSGISSCNNFSGEYEISGDKIKTGKVLSTLIGCDGDKIETNFLSNLQRANRYQIKDRKLFLSQNKKLLLTFETE